MIQETEIIGGDKIATIIHNENTIHFLAQEESIKEKHPTRICVEATLCTACYEIVKDGKPSVYKCVGRTVDEQEVIDFLVKGTLPAKGIIRPWSD